MTGWTDRSFDEIVDSRGSGGDALAKSEWATTGRFPVIGQGAEAIEGWTDRDDLVIEVDQPLVLYGGHTQRAKIVKTPFVPGPNVKILRPKSGLNSQFLFYFLNFLKVEDKGYGDHFPLVRKSNIPLPAVDEQQRIVAVLDEAFAAITTATANAEKNLANARELFASELDALVVEAQARFPSGALIDQCVGMTVGHVGPMKDRYQPEGIPFLRSQNVRPFEISFDGMMFIDDQFDGELRKSRLRPGDVAVVRTGYPGTAAVIPPTLLHANCSDLVIIRPGKTLNPHFVAAFLNSNIGKRAVSGELVGAAQKHFNVGSAKKVAIPLPSLDEQAALLNRVSAFSNLADQLIELSKSRLRQLVDLKSAILHAAFNGSLIATIPETIAA